MDDAPKTTPARGEDARADHAAGRDAGPEPPRPPSPGAGAAQDRAEASPGSPPRAEPAPTAPTRPGPLYAGPAPRPPASGRRRTRSRRAAYALAAPLLRGVIRLLSASWRVRVVEGGEHLEAALAGDRPVVLCFWHDELVAGVGLLSRRFRARGKPLAYMVSPSVDGDLVTRVLEGMGGLVARGSATRSGVKALRDLYRLTAKQGASPVILPDGPQGPPRVMKEGAILLSQLSGAPILCVATAARASWRLATWDRLRVPLPFTRLALAVAAPRAVGATATAEALEAERRALESDLLALGERAAAALRR